LLYDAPAETTRIDFYLDDDFQHKLMHNYIEFGIRVTVNPNNEIIYSFSMYRKTDGKYANKI